MPCVTVAGLPVVKRQREKEIVSDVDSRSLSGIRCADIWPGRKAAISPVQ